MKPVQLCRMKMIPPINGYWDNVKIGQICYIFKCNWLNDYDGLWVCDKENPQINSMEYGNDNKVLRIVCESGYKTPWYKYFVDFTEYIDVNSFYE